MLVGDLNQLLTIKLPLVSVRISLDHTIADLLAPLHLMWQKGAWEVSS
jgi:hypothetical protein